MIRRNQEKKVEIKQHPFDGDGQITIRSLLNGEAEMYAKGRVFAHTTVQPAVPSATIPTPTNPKLLILSGTAEFNDNGTPVTVGAGDVCYTPSGEGHGIRNNGKEPVELIA